MIASGDVEFEGVTTFAKDSSTNYRYTVALKDNKLNFSLEDCSIKKQWFKGGMDKADYVTTDNAISGASPADYLKCFHNALSCALEGSNDSQRKLSIYIVWPTVKRVPLDNSDDDTEDDDEDLCVRLLKNGECIEVGYLVEEINFVSLIAIGRFQEGDKLAVTTDFAMEGTSTLYIVRLGN
ncbi:hypothetical protein PF005_g19136 [Phytophthora fragariae]|uniref:Uncharacterized protein n=1 Tax=Phytophthora fragariae TaxID=53985 RepID=A0A6A3WU13_9STRA|nr:hypothetical protein PF005_g19136 [Phytophthora fragariae]